MKPQSIMIRDIPVQYLSAGEEHERAILLLHGGLGDAHSHWETVIPLLAEEYHTVAPDLPGFGGSPVLPNQQIDTLVEWVGDLMDALGLEQAALVGHSFGGLLARLFAAQQPQLTPAVILVSGGTIPRPNAVFRTILNAIAGTPVLGTLVFGFFGRQAVARSSLESIFVVQSALTDDFARRAKLAAPGFAMMIRAITRYPLREQDAIPLLPTLILWGANDEMIPLAHGKDLEQIIVGAQLIPIVDCGHMPQLEESEVFVWQVLQFLTQLQRTPRGSLPSAGPLRQ